MYVIHALCLLGITTQVAQALPPLPKLADKGKGIVIDEDPAESSICNASPNHRDPQCSSDPITSAVAGSVFGPLPSVLGRGMVPAVDGLATYNPYYDSGIRAGAYHGNLPGMMGLGGQANMVFDIARWVEGLRRDRSLHNFRIPFRIPAISMRGYFKTVYNARTPGQFSIFAQIEILDFLTEARQRLGWIIDYAAVAFTVCKLDDLNHGLVRPFVSINGKWYGFYEWSTGQAPTKAPYRVQTFFYPGASAHWDYARWGRPDLVVVYFVRFRIHHFDQRHRIGP